MGVNKVIYYGEVLVDMSQVTVTPETLGKGATALDAKGELITGLHECEESEPKLQSKTVTPTTSLQTVNPDAGYDGLSKVTVNAMPAATQATPSISVSTAGLITASATQTAGYVSAGTKSATKQLTTQAAKTVTPSTSNQTAVESGRYTTGAVTVAAVPTETKTITANGTYTPTSGKFFSSVDVNVASSGGGASLETCAVAIRSDSLIYSITYMTVDANGAPIYACITPNSSVMRTITCLCNSAVAISHSGTYTLSAQKLIACSLLHSRAYFCSVGLGNTSALIDISVEGSGGGSQ